MPTQNTVWLEHYQIPSITDEGHKLLDNILKQLHAMSWDTNEIFAIHLALEEAIINAIRHGNSGDASLMVTVDCKISPSVLEITITDEGQGFNPDALPDPTCEDYLERPCGRGVMLMRRFMTQVSFNKKGNQVTLIKKKDDGI